jgi:type II secretory ATPase GspE/PulE/Tfp pilus assembly ATPase PilB-like protein
MDPQKSSFIKDEVSGRLDSIIVDAIEKGASDIHFDPERDSLNIRFRIDGVLYPVQYIEQFQQDALLTRIKVVAQIKITEHRLPQDGHFEFKYKDKVYNIRVATLPTTYGETIVLRIFNRADILINLENMGLEKDQLQVINEFIATPTGMVLITGPTGSGKTNLLYSLINSLNQDSRNIVTLEDPIEYQMPMIRQSQVSEDTGFTFARAMRSIIRQDPDVVMIGEIRDNETAQMSIQAALTGVLILSTFHTFDVPALISRLSEMGISNTYIAQTVKAVIATRLVRKICPSCKEQYNPSDAEKKLLGEKRASQPIFRGKGCDYCGGRKYVGRTGIFEVVRFGNDLRSAIIERRTVAYINDLLRSKNIKSLFESGMNKVANGTTSIEEVIRVVGYPAS